MPGARHHSERASSPAAWLKQAEARTGIPRVWLFLALSFGVFAFVFLGFGAAFFTTLIGTLYPAYASFRAIESAGKQDDTQWWVEATALRDASRRDA